MCYDMPHHQSLDATERSNVKTTCTNFNFKMDSFIDNFQYILAAKIVCAFISGRTEYLFVQLTDID